MNPVQLGDFAHGEDEEAPRPPPQAPFKPLCDNCFHRLVCGVVTEIKKIGSTSPFGEIAVGFCPHHMPAYDEEPGPGPQDPTL